jgi:hypothetical protein
MHTEVKEPIGNYVALSQLRIIIYLFFRRLTGQKNSPIHSQWAMGEEDRMKNAISCMRFLAF